MLTPSDILLLWPLLHQIRCSTSERLASHQDTDPITMKSDFAPEHHFTITQQAHLAPAILAYQSYCSWSCTAIFSNFLEKRHLTILTFDL